MTSARELGLILWGLACRFKGFSESEWMDMPWDRLYGFWYRGHEYLHQEEEKALNKAKVKRKK